MKHVIVQGGRAILVVPTAIPCPFCDVTLQYIFQSESDVQDSRVQHGENPEHVFLVDGEGGLAALGPRFTAWLERLHGVEPRAVE